MGADNVVFVQKRGWDWNVWYQGNPDEPDMGLGTRKFDRREDALVYAHDYVADLGYVEYGVVELEE